MYASNFICAQHPNLIAAYRTSCRGVVGPAAFTDDALHRFVFLVRVGSVRGKLIAGRSRCAARCGSAVWAVSQRQLSLHRLQNSCRPPWSMPSNGRSPRRRRLIAETALRPVEQHDSHRRIVQQCRLFRSKFLDDLCEGHVHERYARDRAQVRKMHVMNASELVLTPFCEFVNQGRWILTCAAFLYDMFA